MKLTPCKSCGEMIAPTAQACPKCGRNYAMEGAVKGCLWIIALVVLAGVLCAAWVEIAQRLK